MIKSLTTHQNKATKLPLNFPERPLRSLTAPYLFSVLIRIYKRFQPEGKNSVDVCECRRVVWFVVHFPLPNQRRREQIQKLFIEQLVEIREA